MDEIESSAPDYKDKLSEIILRINDKKFIH